MSETRWNMPNVTPIRDQAAARGEPVPVGKTTAEIRSMGYEVRDDVAEFAVLVEELESPTGYVVAVRLEDLDRLLHAYTVDCQEAVAAVACRDASETGRYRDGVRHCRGGRSGSRRQGQH
jgi:hypothetical protein